MQSQMTGFASKTILVEFSRHFKPARGAGVEQVIYLFIYLFVKPRKTSDKTKQYKIE